MKKDNHTPKRRWWIAAVAAICIAAELAASGTWSPKNKQPSEQDEAAFVSYAETYADLPKFSTQYYWDAQSDAFYGIDHEGIFCIENGEKTVIASGDYYYGGMRYCTDGKTFYGAEYDTETEKEFLVRRDLESGVEETLFEAPYGKLVGVIGEKIYFFLYGEDVNDTDDNRLAAFDCSGNEIETVVTGIRSADQKDGLILIESAGSDDSGAHGITVLSCNGKDRIRSDRALSAKIYDAAVYWLAPKDATSVSIVKSDGKNRMTVGEIELPEGIDDIYCESDGVIRAQKFNSPSEVENCLGLIASFWLYDLKTGQPLSDKELHLPQNCDFIDTARDDVTGNIYGITIWVPTALMAEVYQLVDGEMQFLADDEYFNSDCDVRWEAIHNGRLYYSYSINNDRWQGTVVASKKLPELQMAD